MSFSGKRYRRIGTENLDELVRVTRSNASLLDMYNIKPPIFSFTRLNEFTFRFCLQSDNKYMWYDFRLGEEFEMEIKNGRKIKIMFTLESDNILKQRIRKPNGRILYFIKEFGEHESKMTIMMEGTDAKATVFYEAVK